jgi:hypothetical protein
MEEADGNIDYLGWVGKQDSDFDDDVNVVTVKFAWQGKKTSFLRHLYIKCIILPRQARDKHRESTQTIMAFSYR